VPIYIPPLRERKEDVHLLFRKFASDFADKYRMPSVTLTSEAIHLLTGYRWPGNIRQLKNMVEQISIIEGDRNITASTLSRYLPDHGQMEMPVLYQGNKGDGADFSDRDILFKVLFDLRKENKEYRQEMQEMSQRLRRLEEFAMGSANLFENRTEAEIKKAPDAIALGDVKIHPVMPDISEPEAAFSEVMEEPLSLQSKEFEMIRKALIRNNGHRKQAAIELGISERTLYRKIKEYKLDYLSTNKG
jgi:DNA-binding NtrC family response regulator